MRIPEIRAELRQLAIAHGIPRLDELANELIRRKGPARTRTKSQPMTEDLAEAIREYKDANPRKSYVEIARRFNVNPGRVSEAIIGERS